MYSMKRFVPLCDIDSVLSVLSQTPIWGGTTDLQRTKIYDLLETGTFMKGEYIFQKGDEPEYLYIVKSGVIDLLIGDHEVILEKKALTTGECFGVASLMSMQRHTATAIALEESEIMVLSRQALLRLQHEDIELFALLLMNIARELARRINLTDNILLRYIQTHTDYQPEVVPHDSSHT
jgi:CRP/FNR family cyclic AMP-dependent transcriptional regulator